MKDETASKSSDGPGAEYRKYDMIDLVLLTAILPKNVFKSNLRRLCHRCWCGGQLYSPLPGFPRTKNASIGAGTKYRLIHQGCALTAPGRLGRLKIFSWSPGRATGISWSLKFHFSKKKKENVVQSGARWYSKVVPREFTCNIIIDFDRDKLHSFRF